MKTSSPSYVRSLASARRWCHNLFPSPWDGVGSFLLLWRRKRQFSLLAVEPHPPTTSSTRCGSVRTVSRLDGQSFSETMGMQTFSVLRELCPLWVQGLVKVCHLPTLRSDANPNL